MACTLRELQDTEYEILCKFADFCEAHNLPYTLAYGTLLGAIRHNGFIPWDDDVDILMNARDFRKLLKLLRKNPLDGYELDWVHNEVEYPVTVAKLRKNGTSMVEHGFRNLHINHGVWVDVFFYFDRPKSAFLQKLQDGCIAVFTTLSEKYINRDKVREGVITDPLPRLCRFADRCPDKLLRWIKMRLFNLCILIGNKKSETVRAVDGLEEYSKRYPRNRLEPTTKHIFEDREFNIPVEYDQNLIAHYGDYMTPVETHIHVRLDKIEL